MSSLLLAKEDFLLRDLIKSEPIEYCSINPNCLKALIRQSDIYLEGKGDLIFKNELGLDYVVFGHGRLGLIAIESNFNAAIGKLYSVFNSIKPIQIPIDYWAAYETNEDLHRKGRHYNLELIE